MLTRPTGKQKAGGYRAGQLQTSCGHFCAPWITRAISTVFAGIKSGLAGQTGREFAGGEGVEGAEAGGEFGGGQAAFAEEPAEEILVRVADP